MDLCDRDLKSLCAGGAIVQPYDESLVNPASIDIRVGSKVIREITSNSWQTYDISKTHRENPVLVYPNEFILVETFETLIVPNGYVLECRLKSTMARRGLDHSLAFWFDPGWHGVGTFEFKNVSVYQTIRIWYKMPIAQVIVRRLSGDAERPYSGKYQGAKSVELAKP